MRQSRIAWGGGSHGWAGRSAQTPSSTPAGRSREAAGSVAQRPGGLRASDGTGASARGGGGSAGSPPWGTPRPRRPPERRAGPGRRGRAGRPGRRRGVAGAARRGAARGTSPGAEREVSVRGGPIAGAGERSEGRRTRARRREEGKSNPRDPGVKRRGNLRRIKVGGRRLACHRRRGPRRPWDETPRPLHARRAHLGRAGRRGAGGRARTATTPHQRASPTAQRQRNESQQTTQRRGEQGEGQASRSATEGTQQQARAGQHTTQAARAPLRRAHPRDSTPRERRTRCARRKPTSQRAAAGKGADKTRKNKRGH